MYVLSELMHQKKGFTIWVYFDECALMPIHTDHHHDMAVIGSTVFVYTRDRAYLHSRIQIQKLMGTTYNKYNLTESIYRLISI